MLNNKGGFTLIELVMIIIILGILAAVALPRYIDLKRDAEDAAIKGIYGHIGSAYGITIASLKSVPLVDDVRANLSGDPGALNVNNLKIVDNLSITDNAGRANFIYGETKTGVFTITTVGGGRITDIGSLTVIP